MSPREAIDLLHAHVEQLCAAEDAAFGHSCDETADLSEAVNVLDKLVADAEEAPRLKDAQTSQSLTYTITGDRIEYRFRGTLIVAGSALEDHAIDCLREIRRLLGGGEFGDWTLKAALDLWHARKEVRP